MAVSYEIVTRDRAGRERVHPYAGEDALAPGSVVLLGGRYWLVVRVEQQRAQAHLARYRLALQHPDGHRETGAFRRFRADAPSAGHQLITLEKGVPISWSIVDQRFACDDAGEPFLESIAERDYAEAESLPDHELEHTLDRESDIAVVAASVLARAREAGFAIELVGLEAGRHRIGARRYLDSLIIEEVEDDLLEQCGVDPRHDPQETWLDTVKQRLRDDLDSFRADIEDRHEEIEEWDFRGGRSSQRSAASTTTLIRAAASAGCAGSSMPACSSRRIPARPQAALAALIGGSCYECRRRAAALARAVATTSLTPSIPAAGAEPKPSVR